MSPDEILKAARSVLSDVSLTSGYEADFAQEVLRLNEALKEMQDRATKAVVRFQGHLREAETRGWRRGIEAAAERVVRFHDFGSEKPKWRPALNLNDGRDQLRWYANGILALPSEPPK